LNKAIILGCSHAAGIEMFRGIDQQGLDQRQLDDYGYKNSYPMLIARDLGYVPVNHAIAGGSNDAMYRIGSELIDQLSTNDVVVACWTGPTRTEIWCDEESAWVPLAPGMEHFWKISPDDIIPQGRLQYHQNIKNHNNYIGYLKQWCTFDNYYQRWENNAVKNILALNFIAQQCKIQIINLFSFARITNQYIAKFGKWPLASVDFTSWALSNNHQSTANGHFLFTAHREFADNVLLELKNNHAQN
jgi:hypothetical protein